MRPADDGGADRALAEAAAMEAANSPVFFMGIGVFFLEGKLRGNCWCERRPFK